MLSVLISIFPSKGPHVVPTGSCCRLWIRRSPSLRNVSSSPKKHTRASQSQRSIFQTSSTSNHSDIHSLSFPLKLARGSKPHSEHWRLKPSSFKMDNQIEQAAIWRCSSDAWRANLTWEVSCVAIISVRQCRLTGWWEQLVASLFLLFQEGCALVSAVQSSS